MRVRYALLQLDARARRLLASANSHRDRHANLRSSALDLRGRLQADRNRLTALVEALRGRDDDRDRAEATEAAGMVQQLDEVDEELVQCLQRLDAPALDPGVASGLHQRIRRRLAGEELVPTAGVPFFMRFYRLYVRA